MSYKLLITDLDGTAIPMRPDGVPSPKVIEAVAQAQQKIQVSVATGRPLSMCDDILKLMNISTPCVLHGGTQIFDPISREKLWYQPLNPELMTQIMKMCEPYVFFDEGESPHGKPLEKAILAGNQDMMVFLFLEESEAKKYLEKLKQIKEINVVMMHSWAAGKFDIHITHIGASKRHAVEVLLAKLNIEKHEVLAVGDGGNDLPLFEAAGFKVAMGNASDDLKAEADFIAPTVTDDGLAEVIKKFIL